jgi:CubicO group peptidase (beta-lactamase class C family)
MVRKRFIYKTSFYCSLVLLLFVSSVASGQATSQLPPELRAKIDAVAKSVLAITGVPSASVAIVTDGKISYLNAYGDARIDPPTPARPEMRYAIGSISKQFTAAAILMLAEQGKLSLDDPVSRYVPNLTRGNEVTIRQLLSHTSGYQDYWPQDYVPPFMEKDISANKILDIWARKPLDFDPGTQWQYSNTNFVIAGLIIEKASGMPVLKFLSKNVFEPLGMKSVVDIDESTLTQTDPVGYLRYALGPLRVAPIAGKGWTFAAFELSMPAEELAKWDISVIDQSLMKSDSYRELETEVLLKNGAGTNYALGIGVQRQSGHRALSHGGEVSGFTATNTIFPDDRAAVVVLTNEDAATASSEIAKQVAPLLFQRADAETQAELEKIRKIFEGLQEGSIDRSQFTDNCNAYFSKQAIDDFKNSLGPLGTPPSFTQTSYSDRGGMSFRAYRVEFPRRTVGITVREMPDGKIEQYQVMAEN